MKILIVDDEKDARKFLRYIASRAGHEVIEAENGSEGLRLAAENAPELIISDALMPVMDGFHFLREIKKDEALKHIPFIFYSATYTGDEDVRLAMSLGAEAYIVKPMEPEELWAEIGRALERSRKEKAPPGRLAAPEAEKEYLRRHTQVMALKLEETVVKLKDALDGQKISEESLRRKTEELEKFFTVALDLLCIADTDANFRLLNPAWERTLGYTREELMARKFLELVHPDDVAPTLEAVARLSEQKEVANFVNRYRCKDGTYRWLEWRSAPAGDLIYAAARDITERQLAAEERQALETQLRQSQKLESVGRLAGGVAHDFNNLLTAMEGYSDLLLKALAPDDPRHADVEEIKKAAERASALTRQLLAFSRRQIMAMQAVDINAVLRNVENMLGRLIGENYRVIFRLDSGVKTVMADPGQIEQVIMNLALNARDAMPDGGEIGFETGNITISGKTSCYLEDAAPGDYVCLTITDKGCGMDAETKAHIFEPFFTTKGQGKGTGLGLSTVYGIVKQFKGYIGMESEVNAGTSVKIYLPACGQQGGAAREAAQEQQKAGGGETILVVEDEDAVRKVTRRILEENGYKVFVARSGDDALRMLPGIPGHVDIAIVDLVLPDIPGRELGELIMAKRPGIKIIYTSGYTDDSVIRSRGIGPSTPFLQKPLQATTLLHKVRQVADSK